MTHWDEVAESYAALVEPHFRPVAGLLPARLGESARRCTVLEIAAGTGLLTGLMARDVLDSGGSWTATDQSVEMLRVARTAIGTDARFACADAGALPFPDAAVDLVVSSLGPVQETVELLGEARRVLRPGGTLALTLWDAGYAEWQLMREPRSRMGAPEFAADPVGDACERARAAGLVDVGFDVTRFDVVHDDMAAYLAFRAAFGHPPFVAPDRLDEWVGLIRDAAAPYVDRAGRVVLDWRVAVFTARRPG